MKGRPGLMTGYGRDMAIFPTTTSLGWFVAFAVALVIVGRFLYRDTTPASKSVRRRREATAMARIIEASPRLLAQRGPPCTPFRFPDDRCSERVGHRRHPYIAETPLQSASTREAKR